jgi:transglutaminase-like putative cysteine protease
MTIGTRRVGCTLTLELGGPVTLALQVAVAKPVDELLLVSSKGQPVEIRELDVEGTRVHVAEAPGGSTVVTYTATVEPPGAAPPVPVSATERLIYRRPSRYCPSDTLVGFADRTFDRAQSRRGLVSDVVDWVSAHLTYQPVSGPTDSAVDTLLAGAGVCRDYAHLTVTLLRALDVPARLVAVYAPGLGPMDFHAVVEAEVDDVWRLVDATHLAPRHSMVRIGAGRDAADTAFLTSFGPLTLAGQTITATVDGDLPFDDGRSAVALA